MRPTSRTAMLLACLLVAAVGLFSQTADQLTGTWKLNVAKSKFNPPEFTPKSGMTKFEVSQGGVKMISDGVDYQGRTTHAEYTAKFDGKDYPWKGTIDGKPNPDQDGISWKKIDDYTYEVANKLKGKTTTSYRLVISKDGKTRTNTVTGKNAQGQAINHVQVYEKQ